MTITASTSAVAVDPIRVLMAGGCGADRIRGRRELHEAVGFTVVAEAVNARQALAVAGFEHPDVVVLDPDLPNEDDIDLVAELAARAPRARIVLRPEAGWDALRAALSA